LTGQRVLGPARVIQEVRNAITAYDALPSWDPAKPTEPTLSARRLANDWFVVNQLAVQGSKFNRRPDVVVYVNGLCC